LYYLRELNVNSSTAPNCSDVNEGNVYANPVDCHQFYLCTENSTAVQLVIKLALINFTNIQVQFIHTFLNYSFIQTCPPGYGFHLEWQICVPENHVNACHDGEQICPPYMFDGVVPDKKDCQSYYRCLYGMVYHYKCPPNSVFTPETGNCKRYSKGKEPECLKGWGIQREIAIKPFKFDLIQIKNSISDPLPPPVTTTTTTPLPPTVTITVETTTILPTEATR
jgi:hypothetical protein